MNVSSTPVHNPKKRELTSPEFDIESKKNKVLSHSLSPLGRSDVMATNTITDETSSIASITLGDAELRQLSSLMEGMFMSKIKELVTSIVEGVSLSLEQKLTSIQQENSILKSENDDLRAKISTLETSVDANEQYSRRNCIRISGIDESSDEKTDAIVLSMAKSLNCDIQLEEIDRSHRVGKSTPRTTTNNNGHASTTPAQRRTRDIIVKFSSYRARQKFYMSRSNAKSNGYKHVYINEDLTRRRSSLLFRARQLVKSHVLLGAWSSDGTILVKDTHNNVHRILSDRDLHRLDCTDKM